MTEPVLFLDIDGVLNSARFFRGKTLRQELKMACDEWWAEMLDPEAVVLLNDLIVRTGALVVVSSTWRWALQPADLERVLVLRGFVGRIIGATPRLSDNGSRGAEILAYLQQHPDIANFVLLDDDKDLAPLLHRAVITEYENGLTQSHVNRAIGLLQTGFNNGSASP